MNKAWSFVAFVIVLLILLTVAIETVKPWLPIVGLALALMVVLAAGFVIARALLSRKRFF